VDSPSDLAYRVVELALRLEEAEREKNDEAMGRTLALLIVVTRALREAERRALEGA